MQKPDLQQGDEISVQTKIVEVFPSGNLRIVLAHGYVEIEPGEVYSVTKRAIRTGDRVAFKEAFDTSTGNVVAIVRGFALVDLSYGTPRVVKLEDLERLTPGAAAGAAS